MWGPWLASDRTPLLAAVLLIIRSSLIEPLATRIDSSFIPTAYIAAAIVALSSWVAALYQLCRQLIGSSGSRWLMLIAATSPFFFFNTVYTWPKMLGATYVLLAVSLLLHLRKMHSPNGVDLTIVAMCASLAYLSHGSNAFALLPVALVFAGTILRQQAWRIAAATLAALVVALPWFWWQITVQPGGDALVRGALAGGLAIDRRGAPLLPDILQAYERLGLDGWRAAKAQGLLMLAGWPTIPFGEQAIFSPGLGVLGTARVHDFFLVTRGIPFAVLGLFVLARSLFVRRDKSNVMRETGLVAIAGLGGILLVWLVVLQFQITHVHAFGAIALVFLAGSTAIINLCRDAPLVVSALVALSIAYFGIVWIFHPLWIALRVDWLSLVAFLVGIIALAMLTRGAFALPN